MINAPKGHYGKGRGALCYREIGREETKFERIKKIKIKIINMLKNFLRKNYKFCRKMLGNIGKIIFM